VQLQLLSTGTQPPFPRVYPSANQLAVQGSDNLFYYTLGNHIWRKSFCKTCGVHIGSELNPDVTDEQIAALPEAIQKHRLAHLETRPFNTRLLNGFDVKCLSPVRGDGWGLQKPEYVYP